uniref:Uncharacterized protein n=1 Tax=Arundo donax TaxID=35708 RepID=A0A0A9FPC5_ARUDO
MPVCESRVADERRGRGGLQSND